MIVFRALGYWLLNVLIGLYVLANAILLGSPYETISRRTSRRMHVWGWRQLGRFLEAIDPGHLDQNLGDPSEYDLASRLRK